MGRDRSRDSIVGRALSPAGMMASVKLLYDHRPERDLVTVDSVGHGQFTVRSREFTRLRRYYNRRYKERRYRVRDSDWNTWLLRSFHDYMNGGLYLWDASDRNQACQDLMRRGSRARIDFDLEGYRTDTEFTDSDYYIIGQCYSGKGRINEADTTLWVASLCGRTPREITCLEDILYAPFTKPGRTLCVVPKTEEGRKEKISREAFTKGWKVRKLIREVDDRKSKTNSREALRLVYARRGEDRYEPKRLANRA